MRAALTALALLAATPALADWQATLDAARGQTVYVNAWGGDPRTNAFLDWVGDEVLARHGVTLEHVKLTDTAEAVNRVVAEQAAGKTEGGTVDLIWINGPNFASMKGAGLLHGPFVADLPNAAFLDLTPGAPASLDFTVPVEGFESPWRLARFVFAHDGATGVPPATMAAMVDWAAAHPGRLTHPDPSNFIGATFLKQALIELAPDPSALQSPVTEKAFAEQTAALWAWYDALRPNLWRGGETFPENETAQAQLMNDGEVAIAMFFDPAAPAALIEQGLLPETARVFVPEGGSIGNISFLAIPFNAQAREGAMVVANHLLDPAVQARQQDITVLGSFSVLDPAKLPPEAAAAFAALPTHPALPTLESLGPTLAEPHGSWMTRLTEEWSRRYVK
jgi:putative thiamine transport system substrate-binding protein